MKKLLMALLALAWMAGCSSEPSKPAETAKPQPKPPELLTGRGAFQKLYIAARSWAPDAKPYRLESSASADSAGHEGKSALWRAGFASAVQRGTKPYTWSGSEHGVNPGIEDTYNPNNASTTVFDAAFLKTDSPDAFDVAQKHGGDKLLEKAPDTPVLYSLDWNRVTNELTWHVTYGTSRDEAKLKVDVNAATGEFIRVEK